MLPGLSHEPTLPRCFISAKRQLIGISYQRYSEQKGLLGQLVEPSVVRKLRIAEAELLKTSGILVDERDYAKLLSKSSQLAQRCGPLHQVDEMGFYSAFGKEAKGLSRIGTFPDSENLNFQCLPSAMFRGHAPKDR
jgi:hypothetical protein